MKRKLEETTTSSSVEGDATTSTLITTTAIKAKKKKRKNKASESDKEEKLVKAYMKIVDGLIPTIPSDKVETVVRERAPESIRNILKALRIDQNESCMKLIQQDKVILAFTDIVIDGVNKPVRRLITDMPFHFDRLSKVVGCWQTSTTSVTDALSKSIGEELCEQPPPGEGEPEFTAFVDQLKTLMTNIIKRVAAVIENNELISTGNVLKDAVVSHINVPIIMKRQLCKQLFNQIAWFAGATLYTYFISDEKLIKDLINKHVK